MSSRSRHHRRPAWHRALRNQGRGQLHRPDCHPGLHADARFDQMMNGTASNQTGVAVTVRGLRKSFGGQEVLRGLDFEVQPGEIFVIMGPSGSGKSVLLKHIIGLEPPDAGEILINGDTLLSEQTLEKYRLAMVFQSGALLNSLTVGENVGLYLAEHRLKPPGEIARIVAEKLAIVGLKG